MAKVEGYYFASSDEGTMAIQFNDPGPGAAKFYWRPAADIDDSKNVDTYVSMECLEKIIDQIVKDRQKAAAEAAAKKNARG